MTEARLLDQPPNPLRLRRRDIAQVLRAGWGDYRAAPGISSLYAAMAVLIGLALLAALGHFGFSPMSLPFAGGFMLVAPAMLSGFFHIAMEREAGRRIAPSTPFVGFVRAPLGVWMVALFSAFVFLIWITDAGVLYSFMIGGVELPYELPWMVRMGKAVASFWMWGALMGSVLAFIIFCVSAFSVPLLYERRSTLVRAVHASVRTVFASLSTCLTWGLLLSVATIAAIVLLPLLLAVLPVLAFASFRLYRLAFPLAD